MKIIRIEQTVRGQDDDDVGPQVRDEPHGFPAGLRGGLDGALFPLADGGQENRWMRYGNRTKNRHGIPPPVNSF